MEKIVNIVNFVRGVEPRLDMDLLTPVAEEIRLNKQYGYENTFLLQYDAMMDNRFVDLFLKEKDERMALGIWIEMARCLIESIGLEWEGRPGFDWDWFVNPGFLLAYTKSQKEQIIDRIMEKFRACFGYYPKSAGSWMLDTDSVSYMCEKYGVQAFCICREQWGTDAYTLWGGYYNGPYFPSRNHILHPAQTEDAQIHAPVFRMLGPDPIYCYYEKQVGERNKPGHTLYTLEPAWHCGKNPEWVQWYFRNFLDNEDMGYQYTQVGQENSFGWPLIRQGLPMQYAYLDALRTEGKIRIEKLCDTAGRFRQSYAMTPSTVYSAMDDWAGNGNQAVWYSCKNYRMGLMRNLGEVFIGDLQKYDEKYRDVYLDTPCKKNDAVQDALPVIDGIRFSDEKTLSGLYFGQGRIEKTWRDGEVFLAQVTADGNSLTLALTDQQIVITADSPFKARYLCKENCPQLVGSTGNALQYLHNGHAYALVVESGSLVGTDILSDGNTIKLSLQ